MVAKFGTDVERKNKSIKIHGNTYRKDADSVPCMRYRDYSGDYRKDESNYVGGVVIFPDDGRSIINYPEQHIMNGKAKNVSTNYYYKKMVRIMKKMRYLMQDSYISATSKVSSFALESLLWNIPDSHYLEYGKYRKVFHFKSNIDYLKSHKDEILGEQQLTYCYLNTPIASVRDRSAIHYGMAMLCVDKTEEITSTYFTDRKSTGDMYFTLIE